METKSDKIRKLIAAQKGRFFSLDFVKRANGEKRHFVGRKKVKKYLTGGSLPYSPKDHNLEIIWEIATKSYKAIPLESVYLFNGKEV